MTDEPTSFPEGPIISAAAVAPMTPHLQRPGTPWSGGITVTAAGNLNTENLTHSGMPGFRFRIGRRKPTHQNRAGGTGWTALLDHTHRPYSNADPHYGPFVSAQLGRTTDHRHLFFGTEPELHGELTNDPYPEAGNPHLFHLARQNHVGRTNVVKVGERWWGNRSKHWIPEPRAWSGSPDGHAPNPYWASIRKYAGPIEYFPRGVKLMCLPWRADLETDVAPADRFTALGVLRAEALTPKQTPSGVVYNQLRVTVVYPRYADTDHDLLTDFNPENWRWSLPPGQDGTGRWRCFPTPDLLTDFMLTTPVPESAIPPTTQWANRTRFLLDYLDFDTGPRVTEHAELLPDFSDREDFPDLPPAQEVLYDLGGLCFPGGARIPWKPGNGTTPPPAGTADDKFSIAENIVVTIDATVPTAPPYPAPIMVTSPRNQPVEEPEPPDPPDPEPEPEPEPDPALEARVAALEVQVTDLRLDLADLDRRTKAAGSDLIG